MATSAPSGEEKQLAALAHVLGIVTSFVAPLIILFTNSKKSTFVEAQAKEALNFQLTVMAGHIVNAVLTVILFFVWPLFAWAVTWGLWIICIWWSIVAFQAANNGQPHRYPFAFRIIA